MIDRFLTSLITPLLFWLTSSAAGAAKPNIVFLLADDLGWRDTGYMGSDFYRTPNLDALAQQGMVFTDAYANAPNCAPSRAALLSGMYAPRTGVYTVNNPDRGKAEHRRLIPHRNVPFLNPQVVTLAEVLKSAGYATATVGKFHVGDAGAPSDPQNQGFDVNIAGYSKGHPHSYFSPYQNPRLSDGPESEYLTDRLTDEAIGFIRAHRDRPFFLYFPYYTVHTPIRPRPDLHEQARRWPKGKLHQNPEYAAMVSALDQSVGRVLATLDELGLAGNTIVVFSSDNGGHGRFTDMTPLRGSKGMFYEGGIRVPLTVRWPGVTRPGTRTSEPVLLFDFYPTLVEAAGGVLPGHQPVDGVSLAPLLRDEPAALPDRALFWHFPAYLQAGRGIHGRWRATPGSIIRRGDWKLIEQYETDTIELYNLAEDLGETNDLAAQRPDVTKRLLEELHAWQRSVNAPTTFEPNPAYKGG